VLQKASICQSVIGVRMTSVPWHLWNVGAMMHGMWSLSTAPLNAAMVSHGTSLGSATNRELIDGKGCVVLLIFAACFICRFGVPLILRVWRDLTHSQFQSVVLKAMVRYLREGIRLPDVCRSGVLFRCRVVDGLQGRSVLPIDADHPFYSPSVDK